MMENKVIAKEYVEKNYIDKKEYEKIKKELADMCCKYVLLCNAIVCTYGEEELEELKKLVEFGG